MNVTAHQEDKNKETGKGRKREEEKTGNQF